MVHHQKILAVAQIAYCAASALPIFAITGTIAAAIEIPGATDSGDRIAVHYALTIIWGITLIVCAPFILTAYGVWRGRSWAKYSAVGAIVLSILNFPIGTALSVYTVWYFWGR